MNDWGNLDPDWVIKEPEKKPPIPIINSETGLEVKKNALISISYRTDISEETR